MKKNQLFKIQMTTVTHVPPFCEGLNHKIVYSKNNSYVGQIEWRPNDCYIGFLLVAEKYRREGYGSALISELEKILIKQGCSEINVNPSTSSKEFYIKNGFVPNKYLHCYSKKLKDKLK